MALAVLQAPDSHHGSTRAFLASEGTLAGPRGQWESELPTEQTAWCFVRHAFPRRNRKTLKDPARSVLPDCWYLCMTYSWTDLCHQQLIYCHSQECTLNAASDHPAGQALPFPARLWPILVVLKCNLFLHFFFPLLLLLYGETDT